MSRKAAATICPRCWAYTLTGDDGDTCALTAAVDDVALTRSGELLAVIAGRTTYEMDLRGALHRRDRWMLAGPAGGPAYADHVCDNPIPVHWRQPASAKPQPKEVIF